MPTTRLIAGLLATVLVLAACGGSAEEDSTTTTIRDPVTTSTSQPSVPIGFELISADVPRQVGSVSEAELAAVVRGDAALGLDILRTVAGDENLMISPYSIASALSMLYAGARGTTAEEMADVMHLTVDDATLHAARSFIDAGLARDPGQQGEDDTRTPFTIRPANSAWGQAGYPFLDDYLVTLATDYGAGLHAIDFASSPDQARQVINGWVEDATEDRIVDLIPEGAIDPLTTLVLVNAIWFHANWAMQFDAERTEPGEFTLLDGTTVIVPMMHGTMRTGFVSTPDFDAVRLPYAGDAAMVVLLPTGSLVDLMADLAPEDLDLAWGEAGVSLTLPKFAFEADVSLTDVLPVLGMEAAFVPPTTGSDDEADLTGISAIRELYVTDVLHKTFVAVDEDGTEAAAATAVIVGRTSAPPPATLNVDRPFLFWIEHTLTGELLFLGQVTDPR